MIALLLNSTFWIILGTVVFTALVIYFCHKSQVFAHIAKIAGIFLGVALLGGSAIYSVYQVNGYYSAEGGIIGKITNTFKPNVVNVNDFEIKIDNIELQQEFEDTYLAEITINQEIKLDSNKKYALFVNGAPTSCFASESNYIGGVYGYAFYGANNTLLLHDDLVIELALYKNYSLMFLYTMGGNTAVDYWNYYFNRNDFVVTIEEIDVAAINNNEEITGVIPEYYTVSYCVEDEVVAKQIYHPNDTIELTIEDPEAPEDYHAFSGWTVNDSTIDETFRVTGNIVANATFEMQYGLYDNNARLTYSWEELLTDGYLRFNPNISTELAAPNTAANNELSGTLIIAEGVTSLNYGVFRAMPNVTSVKFPSTCRSTYYSFADSGVQTVELNEGLQTIGERTFMNSDITSIVIPGTVIEIGEDAFRGASIANLTFAPNSNLRTIGTGAFLDTQLSGVVLPDTVQSMEGSFSGQVMLNFPESLTVLSSDFECLINNGELVVPSQVLRISNFNFATLTNLIFESGSQIEEIGGFEGCINLVEVVLPDSLERISSRAFYGCDNLSSIIIPNSVEFIGSHAFKSCDNLVEVVLPTGYCDVGYGAFDFCGFTSIWVSKNVKLTHSFDTQWVPIYSDATSLPANWTLPDFYSEYSGYYLKYGYTYEQYLAEINN